MADSFNFSGIASDLADHALDNKEHLFTQLLVPGIHEGIPDSPIGPIDNYMTSIPGTDEVVLTEIFVDDVLQPGGKDTFNPTPNAVGFKTRKGKVRQAKVDVKFTHSKIVQLYKSYLGQVKAKKLDPTTYPFEEFVMNQIIAKAKENLRTKALYNGVYDADGTSPEDVMDGIRTQFLEALAGGQIPTKNIVDVPLFTASNAVSNFKKLCGIIPSKYFYSDLVCITNRDILTAYEDDFLERYGKYTSTDSKKKFIHGTNIEIIVEPGLDDFTRPIITPRGNLCYLYDDEGAMNNLAVDYNVRERNIAYVMDFQAGAGIAVAELLWSTDGL